MRDDSEMLNGGDKESSEDKKIHKIKSSNSNYSCQWHYVKDFGSDPNGKADEVIIFFERNQHLTGH